MLISNLIVYRITFCHNQALLILLSVYQGWLFRILSEKIVGVSFEGVLLGMFRLYALWFKVKGFGFKFIKFCSAYIFLRFNVSHRIVITVGDFGRKFMYKNKLNIVIKDRYSLNLLQAYRKLILFYKRMVYKKLGVYLRGYILALKLSKKKKTF